MQLRYLFILIAFFSISFLAKAQEKKITLAELSEIEFTDATIFKIELKTGSLIVGKIIKNQSDYFVMLTNDIGEVTVLKSNIVSIIVTNSESISDQAVDTSTNMEMAGSYHNLVTTNGYNIPAGEGYLQFTEIFIVSAGYGISKNFSISGGMSLLPGIKLGEQLYFLLPKVSVEIADNVQLAAFVMPLTAGGEGDNVTLWGVTSTIGSRDRNVSIGYTSAFQFEEGGALNVSGTFRVSRKVALITDNLFAITNTEDSGDPIWSLGARLIGNNGSFDFGFLIDQGSEGITIPFISYTFRL